MSSKILLTGGKGMLSRWLVPELMARAGGVRILSRTPLSHHIDSVAADLTKPEQLTGAVSEIDTVIHSASSPYQRTWEIDVEGTRNLVAASAKAGVRHFVYVSITGVDRTPLAYYRAKLAAERLIEKSGLPFTIVRLSQFHDFIDEMLSKLLRWGIAPLPSGALFQPMDAREAAHRVADAAWAQPGGQIPEAGGPQVLPLRDLAKQWLKHRNRKAVLLPLPAVGSGLRAIARGVLTCPRGWHGNVSFERWLSTRS